MYKKSGGYIGFNTPKITGGRAPGGVFTHSDIYDTRKNGALNYPRESIDAAGYEDLSEQGDIEDPFHNRVHAAYGDPEFLYNAVSDETDGWTEQVEWCVTSRIDQYNFTVTTPFHPANRFFSRRFSDVINSYMTVEHSNVQNLGTGPFTIEFWFRRTATDGTDHFIISKGSNTGPTGFSAYIRSDYQLVIDVAGSTVATALYPNIWTTGYTTGIPRDMWFHVAMVREGTGANQTNIYINGRRVAQGTLSGNATPSGQNQMYLGANRDRNLNTTNGQFYIADLRVSNTAVYTSNFACIANSLPVTANTVFMLPLDSATNNMGPADPGSNCAVANANITAIENIFMEPEVPFHHTRPANIAAIWFNSNADYLVTNTASTDYVVGASEFTFETWFYATTYGANVSPIMVSQHGGGANAGQIIAIYQNLNGNGPAVIYPNNAGSGNVIVQGIGDELINANANHRANSVSTGRWHHMAITRDTSNTLRVFLDGNLKHANSGVTFNQSHQNRIWLSTDPTGSRGMHQAWIADSHIANVCLYTGNFTPNVTAEPVRTANTLFALRGNVLLDWANAAGRGANLATTVALDNHTTIGAGRMVSLCRQDGSMSPYKANPMRPLVPDEIYDTDTVEEKGFLSYQKYFSIDTENTSQGAYGVVYQSLKPSDTSLQFGTGAFTFEIWAFPVFNGYYSRFMGCGAHLSTGWNLGYGVTSGGTGTDYKVVFEHGSTEVIASDMPLRVGQWNHIAVVRQGTGTNQSNIFVNGYLAHTFTCATNITAASNPLYIAHGRNPASANQTRFVGRLAMLRLSNTARYTSTGSGTKRKIFNPPTTAFTTDANTRLLMFQHMGGPQQSMIDTGHHMSTVRIGDYSSGGPGVWNPATQVNFSWGVHDTGADLSIWPTNIYGQATSGPSEDFNFGTGDFSFEWFYQPCRRIEGWTDTREPFWMSQRNVYPDDDGVFIVKDTSSNLLFCYGRGANQGQNVILSSRTILENNNSWYHCVIQRVNGHMAMYINGIREQQVVFTQNMRNSYDTHIKFLGGSNVKDGFPYPVNGYVSNFRIFKGAAAYGKDGYNPLHIPVPTKPLDGEHPNCVFLTFSGPALRDYSRNNRYWSYGGHRVTWSAWDRVNDGSRSAYDIVPTGPFPEPIKHWRQGNIPLHEYNLASIILGDLRQNIISAANYNHRISWLLGQQLPFTIEFYFWGIQQGNAGASIAPRNFFSTSASDYTSGRGNSIEIEYHSSSAASDYGGLWFGLKDTGGIVGMLNSGNQSLEPGAGYDHVVLQFDPSATGSNKYIFWVNGIKKSQSDINGNLTSKGYHWNYLRLSNVGDLRISNCARYNPLTSRFDDAVYGILRRDPISYRPIDKHTAIAPVTISPFRFWGDTFRTMTMGPAGISKAAPNTKLPGSRASIFFGQNSSQNSGGYWGATTPPWGFTYPSQIYNYSGNSPGSDALRKWNANYNDFTIEFWVSWAGSASPSEKYIFEMSNNMAFMIVSSGGASRFFYRTSNSDSYRRSMGTVLASSSSNRVYQHCVWQRRNAMYEMFIDGVQVDSFPASNWYSGPFGQAHGSWAENIVDSYVNLGSNSNWEQNNCWIGNFMDFRITRGVARYQRGIVYVNGVPTDGMVYANTDIPVLAAHGGRYTTHFQAGQYTTS